MSDSCKSLEKLDLSNFNIDKVQTMYSMFGNCDSLKELNISNFKFNESINVEKMFSNCQLELKNEIKDKYKNINKNAFYDFCFI